MKMNNEFEPKDRVFAHACEWVFPGLGHHIYLKDPLWWVWPVLTFAGLPLCILPGVIAAVVGHIDLAMKMGTIEGDGIIGTKEDKE